MWYLISLLAGTIIGPPQANSIRTKNTVWPDYKIFYPITEDTIEFKVWAEHDAWIGLFSRMHQTAPKYEIVLGAYDNTIVLIVCNRTITIAKKETKVLDYYDYRDFWIHLEKKVKNKLSRDLKISVGRAGESKPFVETVQPLHFETSYFALASTGAGNNAYWKLKDKVSDTGIEGKTYWTGFLTNTTVVVPSYVAYIDMTDNILRFQVKASLYIRVRLHTADTYPEDNFEIVLGNDKIIVLKNGKPQKSYAVHVMLDPNEYRGFWIDYNIDKDYYENPISIICVGIEGEQDHLVRYIDEELYFKVKYISIATTDDFPGRRAYWLIRDLP